jgi:flagellar biosynthesis GTPase FlhF
MKNIILTLFLLFGMVNIFMSTQSYAMSLDDDEEDMEDAEDYLQKAKQKASSSNFSGAKEELKKAKRLGVLRDDVKDTESYVQRAERNYEARLERERQARLEKERAELARKEKELQERLSRESSRRSYSSSSPSSSSSRDVKSVNVSAEIYGGIFNMMTATNLQMSPSDPNAFIGEFRNGSSYSKTSSHGAIFKGINGIAGYYNYSFQSDDGKIGCSGRIYVSGKKEFLRLSVHRDCSDFGSGEF